MKKRDALLLYARKVLNNCPEQVSTASQQWRCFELKQQRDAYLTHSMARHCSHRKHTPAPA